MDRTATSRWLAVVLGTLLSASVATAESWKQPLVPFLQQHCVECHTGADAPGELDLTTLGDDLTDAEIQRRWVSVHDRLQRREMPPADHSQPSATARTTALAHLNRTLHQAHKARSDVVLRRLNRAEYENTIRDLFGVTVSLKEVLPQDTPMAGFDNVGEGLATSAEATTAYLEAANVALDAAFGTATKPKYLRHETNLLEQKTWDGKPQLEKFFGKMFRRTDDGVVIFQSGYCPTNLVNFARLRAPVGTYRGTLRVRAIQSDKPVTLRIYGGDTIVGRREKHLVGYFDVPPGEWTTIEFTDRLVEPNGTYQPKCYGTKDTRKDADTYPEPGIEIGKITIEGPLEAWPPPSRGQIYGKVDPQNGTLEDARTILLRILPRAFRREVADEEVEPFMALVQLAQDQGRPFEQSLRLGLQGILCSPHFLFLDEPGQDVVSQHALASRLSYFLWSSMPDDELAMLARRGKLANDGVLREQVERMLKDSKSKAFVTNFVGQWLDLREIDFTSPDAMLYPEFDELLRISIVEETHRFFREVLDNDLSVMQFVDSDFTFLNQRLAQHYEIPGIVGQTFRKVTLSDDRVRGGVMTQASVLKVTANGTNTSPVTRGVWVMENILGMTVPPPPSNVPAVEPDIRGATTLREQLAKHRNITSCAVCHDKIDPAGFALENFDVIGGWRDHYRTLGEGQRPPFSRDPLTYAWVRYRMGLPVNAHGRTAAGEAFRDIREFKRLLLAKPQPIVRGLATKLSTYALGRQIGFSDRAAMERIAENVAENGHGLRTLIHEIVQSDLFRSP